MPSTIYYNETDRFDSINDQNGVYYRPSYYQEPYDSGCWTAFRAGQYVLSSSMDTIGSYFKPRVLGDYTTFATVAINYLPECSKYINTTDYASALNEFTGEPLKAFYDITYEIGNCSLTQGVECVLLDPQSKQCRMNVRMQAAFTLAGCLFIKAAYMIILNYRARHRTKDHCLTFGDVIVASVLDPSLKIKNECLLNSGDGYRNKVEHTCHKHCKDPIPSKNGDSIGHCQKCKKFNDVDMAANLTHPNIAIKYERSLLSNLGSTAITQMLILTLTSLAMLGISIGIIVNMVTIVRFYTGACNGKDPISNTSLCAISLGAFLKDTFRTWGGFSSSATATSLAPDSLASEFIAFAISNGAQFFYSLLYLLLNYNLSLILMEHEWGRWETNRKKPRCTIVHGHQFEQSYFLQLPAKISGPLMAYAALMHWLLGQAISTTEAIYTDPEHGIEHSLYLITYASYPIFISTVLMIAMTIFCWWAFTFKREGFIPQM
jgi:hypothetical protein